MKRIALFLPIILFISTLFAQNPALSVPKFKGIEITGTVDQFGKKLSDKGFTFIEKEDFGSIYTGRFAGMSDCIIALIPVENSSDIALVDVLIGLKISEYGIQSYESWEKLLGDYEDLKELLIEKYGKPTEENAGFSEDARTYSSFAKLSAVKEGQCEYYAKWGNPDVDKMGVKLSISGGKTMGLSCAIIALQYRNFEKANDSKKEILDDL